jgi:hypothetical protein
MRTRTTEPSRPSRRRASSPAGVVIAMLLLVAAMLAVGVAPASAGVSGQQEAWGEFGLGPGKLFDPFMMAANREDGSVFIDGPTEDISNLEIQKFSKEGTYEGKVELPGFAYIGIGVDPKAERFYLIEVEEQENFQEFAAARLLAFDTEPNDAGELEPEGELPLPAIGSPGELLFPKEVVFDPKSEELVIPAKNAAGETVLQRIDPNDGGSIGAAWVDSGATVLSNLGIAIDEKGLTYVVSSDLAQSNEIETLPPEWNAASTPTALPGAVAVANELNMISDIFINQPFAGDIGDGSQVAVTTAPNGEDTLFWKGINDFDQFDTPGNILVIGYGVEAEAMTVAFGGGTTEGECKVQNKIADLVTGSGGSLLTFDQGYEVSGPSEVPFWFPVVSRFGPGGSNCPVIAPAVKLTGEGGTQIAPGASVAEGSRVVLDGSGSEPNAQTIAALGWTIEGPDGTTTEDRETAAHVFTSPGTYKIKLRLTPERNGSSGLPAQPIVAAQTLVVTPGSGSTPEFPLSVATTGQGSATVECDIGEGFESCERSFPKGEEIAIKATPESGFEVGDWSGCTETAAGECLVENLSAATSVSAFVGKLFKLNLTKSGTGAGSLLCAVEGAAAGACQSKYGEGETVKVSAAPSAGSEFAGWGGACSGTGSCEVKIEGDESVSAAFNKAPTPPPAETTQPGGNTTQPGGGTTTQPGGATTQPGGSTVTPPPPGGGAKVTKPARTPAQIAKEKRTKALAKCKKLKGKAKGMCVKKADAIGKPKPKAKKH